MQSRVGPVHLLAAAGILGLLVMPVAFAGEGGPRATKSGSVSKQIKKLKQRVAALEAKPDQVGQVPQVPASLPPSGPAGGDLIGAYPSPEIGPDAVTSEEISDFGRRVSIPVSELGSAAFLGANDPGLAFTGETPALSFSGTVLNSILASFQVPADSDNGSGLSVGLRWSGSGAGSVTWSAFGNSYSSGEDVTAALGSIGTQSPVPSANNGLTFTDLGGVSGGGSNGDLVVLRIERNGVADANNNAAFLHAIQVVYSAER